MLTLAMLRLCSCGEMVHPRPLIGDAYRFQHGDNPEHVMTITALEIASLQREEGETIDRTILRYINRRVADWCRAIHAFEQDGRWAGAPDD